MCEVPGLGIGIPSPLDVARSVGSLIGAVNPRIVGVLAGGVAVVAFTMTHALVVGAAVAVFLGGMGTIVWRMRGPDWVPQQAQAPAPALPRNLSITRGRRALPAPAKTLPGVVTGTVVPAPAHGKVIR